MSLLLSRLRGAIQKVTFLLSFDMSKWLLIAARRRRRLSFKSQPGLLDSVSNSGADVFFDAGSISGITRTISSTWSGISRSLSRSMSSEVSRLDSNGGGSRTVSSVSSSWEDINWRAEEFILNFRQHLQKERQVSLELPYSRENSLEVNYLD